MGNRSTVARPQGLYPTDVDDTWLALSVENDAAWTALCGLIGSGLEDLDRFEDLAPIDEVIRQWTLRQDAETAATKLCDAGVAAAPCVHFNDSGRAAQHDSREFFQWRDHPVTGPTPYPSYPFQVDGHHLDLGSHAPLLGQHTAEVLEGIGIDEAGRRELTDAGIIGDWPTTVPRPPN